LRVAAGDKKVAADAFSDLTPEQKAVQEDLVNSLHGAFIDFVAKRRGKALIDPEKNEVFSGRVWTGRAAVKIGLVDGVGHMTEVLREKYGDDVVLRTFGKQKLPWWAGVGMSQTRWGAGEMGGFGGVVDSLVEQVEHRALWAKYGL
jgi:ClpP class serine protease